MFNRTKFLVVFAFLCSFLCFSQNSKTVKDSVKIHYTENAQFPGGDDKFRSEFHKMIHSYIDLGQYAVNGIFDFILNIDEKGKISKVDVFPKVKNSDMFSDDMTFAVKKIKTKWKPAQKDGIPIKSNYIIKINFTSDHFDYGD